jgi:ElaB/YqjD/DUF883 family membrane-anchored ribosome-binding protein
MTELSHKAALADHPMLRNMAVDAMRHVSHASHDARLLGSLASDAIEDGVHAARRTIKRTRHAALDLRDDLAYTIRRQPFQAVATAAAVGALLGGLAGWLARRARG